MSMKNSIDTIGNRSRATFRFVAQCLNHCATAYPKCACTNVKIRHCASWYCWTYCNRAISKIVHYFCLYVLQNPSCIFMSSCLIAALCCAWSGAVGTSQCIGCSSGVPRNFIRGWGGSTNSVEDRGQRERGSGSGSPLVRGSAQFANEWNPYSY
jgi:hypothetical protein